MKPNGLKIIGNVGSVLSVNLKDILQLVNEGEGYRWSILWLKAMGKSDDYGVLDFEKEIKRSESGLLIDWKGLLITSGRFNQIIEILLIGDKDHSKLRRYGNDEEMYINCDYTIELVDSSYWIVHSKNDQLLSSIKKGIKGVEDI